MIAGIVAFFQLLPRLIDLLNRLGTWMVKNNLQDWINDLEASIDQLEQADTSKKKLDAASSLADVIRRIK